MKKVVFIIGLILFMGAIFPSRSQDKITSEALKKHISFLASDSLKGRKPGTIESTIAAQYIADEFKQYGLKLLGNNGFQYFEVKTGVKAGDNHLKIDKKAYSFEKDFNVLSYSENAEIKAPVVFVGYGFNIKKDSLIWNDYDAVDVKGKWVIVLRGYPDFDNPSSKFADFGRDRLKYCQPGIKVLQV